MSPYRANAEMPKHDRPVRVNKRAVAKAILVLAGEGVLVAGATACNSPLLAVFVLNAALVAMLAIAWAINTLMGMPD
jgi:hypothetical protein